MARGEFIAIFDADFIPTADFLTRTDAALHAIRRSAMVQARWGHINQDYSLLTKIQSILLDGHFVLEHGGRNRAGASSTSTARPASGAARRSTTPAAGSTTR